MTNQAGSDGQRQDLTALLLSWQAGDQAALDELIPLVHHELLQLARRRMAGEQAGHTLQATALVNEAYVRLVDLRKIRWQDRAHFFAMASRLMRRILVDSARSRGYQKRGAGARRVTLDDAVVGPVERAADVVALDDALKALSDVDARKAKVVEMRFFGGLTVEETAEVLSVSRDTVLRDWKMAKVWLLRELGRDAAS